MGYWKTKVLPKIKKVFEKNGKKAAAAEACKSFDDSKEVINKEFEEKKPELHTKVVEIYEASSTEIKTLVKERKDVGIKKNSAAVHKFLEELVKIEFPGSKPVCEASTKLGPALVSGPVLFLFEKVSTFVATTDEEKTTTATAATTTEEEEETTSGTKEKEIVIEEGTTKVVEEEIKSTAAPEEEKIEPAAVVADEPAPVHCEPAKTEEAEPAAPKP
ncbi:DREPP family [Macleaya cordata]|uniref:DREPP family n=1 Tax=Macleaya cordata TaxID=56857 RepID=A0A200PT36_MACCD|nr:DREPP family [Macleaya cordata]